MNNKYIYLGIVIVLVIAAVWWWSRTNKPPGDSDKDRSSGGNNTGGNNTGGGSSIEQECGKLSDLFNKARSDDAFASAKLGKNLPPKKCQTYLLQHILNTRGGESLVLDGVFGPKTEAAVESHTGNKTTKLKNHL